VKLLPSEEITTTTKAKVAPSPLLKNGKFDDKTIWKLAPPTAEQRQFYGSEVLKEGKGLSLRMTYGRKRATWYAGIQVHDENGKASTQQVFLGYFPLAGCNLKPLLECEQARDEARKAFKNPQRNVREKEAGTFGDVSRKWFKACVMGRGLNSQDEIQRRLDKYVLHKDVGNWENRPFASIRKADVSLLLNKVQEQAQNSKRKYRGAVQADCVLSTLRMIFVWQSDFMHDDYVLPVTETMKRSSKGKRARKLDDFELKQVWTEAKSEASGEYGRFVRFLVLVPCRRSMVLEMKWTDLKGDTWFIPKVDRAKGAPSFIRLPKYALDLINEQRALRRNHNDRIWHCRALSKYKKAFDARVNAKRREEDQPDMPHYILHDFRRVARSRMGTLKDAEGRTAVLPHVCEAALGHTLKISDVQDHYDINDYAAEVSDALVLYADEVARVVGENVLSVEFPKQTKKSARGRSAT
jgi:integrase